MHKEFQIPINFEKSVVPWIGKTAKLLSIFLKDTFAKHAVDLTKEQFILLKVLHDQDGVIQKDLAFITERNKSSLARLINTMERKNFVARIPDAEDKRINRVHLTAHGHKIFLRIQPVVQTCIQQAQQGLTEEEIKTTIAVLEKVQKNLSLQDLVAVKTKC